MLKFITICGTYEATLTLFDPRGATWQVGKINLSQLDFLAMFKQLFLILK